MDSSCQAAIHRLQRRIEEMPSALVAFSGGVDSAVLLKAAHNILGERVVALTAVSPTFPPEELALAKEMADEWGVKHLLINSNELEREGYVKNAGDRCFFCKTELFELARTKANELGISNVLDGCNLDDMGEHRPGLTAAKDAEVLHPLVDAKMTKSMVRKVAKEWNIPVWDKPAFACLGSRFPVGTSVTVERLNQVQRVESYLRLIGVKTFRVRWHSLDGAPMARIELAKDEMSIVVENEVRETLNEICKAVGFKWVTLDLNGYQRGGLSFRIAG